MNQAPSADPIMWIPRMDVFLSHWFSSYEEARAFLDVEGGYLFPYERQYFVAGDMAVRVLGLDSADPDWARIGFDWVKPADEQAWARLRLQREIAA